MHSKPKKKIAVVVHAEHPYLHMTIHEKKIIPDNPVFGLFFLNRNGYHFIDQIIIISSSKNIQKKKFGKNDENIENYR